VPGGPVCAEEGVTVDSRARYLRNRDSVSGVASVGATLR
jgi:hypothetical protein